MYIDRMTWKVLFQAEFLEEFYAFDLQVQDEIAAMTELLAVFGPALKRPFADTLKGSKFSNMKELRFAASGGVWRLAYAFDPQRNAILLVAGDKSGSTGKRFYNTLISKADMRFSRHIAQIGKRSTKK
jgi:hypothetical protein